ncbi:MAG: hypothetical protein HQL45_05080 [Alphaproteobacteria bacterium]|nr:hypothetical protein [Alphaproteobacteria bacterium]
MASPRTSPLTFRLLTLLAMLLIGGAYVSPIWWVALKAPNYPPQTFPDGVRIHFHVNGVFNGCQARPENSGVDEDEPLDCVHEMNVINHFIGMEPIAEGAKLEIAAAPYLFSLVGVMLLAFLFYSGPFWWVLPLGGIAIPIGFLIDYSAWLWWFGHSLKPWAAFSVKPFMPTVFGEGKVAQFSTFSYPHYGYGLLVAASLLLLLALLLRRKQLRGK